MPMPARRLDALVAILAMTAGATDAISFLGLGGVFSSVMTANLVLLGLGAGQQNGPLAVHAGAALTGYIVAALAASPGNLTTYMTGMLTGILAELAAPGRSALTSRLRLLAMLIAGAVASGVTYTQAPRRAPLIPVALLACVIGLAASTRTSRPAA
jgi:uncharacterized membrane protein YoaK (UPF0700 family)